MKGIPILTLFAAIGCGVMGGMFFTFSTFVMKALGRIAPAGGIAAMQAMNVTILNLWFAIFFMGTAIACVVLAGFSVLHWHEPASGYQLTGSLLYLAGAIGVTFLFNVPRNDALARLDVLAPASAVYWNNYLETWTAWNHVRTVASIAALAAFILAYSRLS